MAIRRVACAISGGVDSAVSALLLKRHGYEVVGVHMVNWDERDEREAVVEQRCSRTQDQADAEWVAEKIGMQLHVVSFVKEYWSQVFERMLANYKLARTVVPDVDCNQHIKFHLLHHFAMDSDGKIGADAVATGHYARKSKRPFPECLQEEEEGASEKTGNYSTKTTRLFKGADPLKDQTFFLSTLRQEQLRRALFPIGHLTKAQVRTMAREAGLDRVSEKRESMGICAVGKRQDFEAFLSNYIEPVEGGGKFVVLHSNEVEEELPQRHKGIHNYTIGKRVSFITHADYPQQVEEGDNCQEGGLYVVRMDPKQQIVYLCRGSHHPLLFAKRFVVTRPHWINEQGDSFTEHLLRRQSENDAMRKGLRPAMPDSLEFRCQRTHTPILCRVSKWEQGGENEEDAMGKLVIETKHPVRAVCPGQRCVFYTGDECLGSSEIDCVKETLMDVL